MYQKISLLCFAFLILSHVLVESKPLNSDLKSYRDERYPDQSYSFSYETFDGQVREESGNFVNVNGSKVLVVKGKYSFVAPDGINYLVSYVADQNGYRATTEQFPARNAIQENFGLQLLTKRINPSLVASLTG